MPRDVTEAVVAGDGLARLQYLVDSATKKSLKPGDPVVQSLLRSLPPSAVGDEEHGLLGWLHGQGIDPPARNLPWSALDVDANGQPHTLGDAGRARQMLREAGF